MAKKSFQIVMDEDAHRVLKARGKSLGINIGDMIENLLSSLELRLRRAYKEAEIESGSICEKSDRMMIKVLLIADQTGDSDNWENATIAHGLLNIRAELGDDQAIRLFWTPEIQLGNKDKD